MAEDQDPLEDATDPTEDTPDGDSEDTAADDQPEGSIDWKARYEQAQRKITAQGQELSAYRSGATDDSDEDDSDEDDEPDDEGSAAAEPSSNLERDSWRLAETLYGKEAMAAYDAAQRILERAETPADWMAAFEAYHDIRTNGVPTKKAKGGAATEGRQTRDQALEPRVDTNRSDPGPDQLEALEEARKSGSLEKFTTAVSGAFGFGPQKRP